MVGCRRSGHAYVALVAPLRAPFPLDLHVLGLPLAFILSQDQTLHCNNSSALRFLRFWLSPSAYSSQRTQLVQPRFRRTFLSSSLNCLKPRLLFSLSFLSKELIAVPHLLRQSSAGPLSISIHSMNVFNI